jgi:RHS repeat-associated protein
VAGRAEDFCFEWNAENQLTRVLKNSVEQARFAYDPLGRRVEKLAGATTTSWTYDTEDILRETNGSTTVKYVHGLGTDEPLAADDGSALSYIQADGLGSIVKTTSSAGAVRLVRQYDAWGTLQSGTTSGYAFTGREWDAETGLYYYRARYYDPEAGRFVTEDLARFEAGVDFYTYVLNSPARFSDPAGRAVEECHRPMNTGFDWKLGGKQVPHGFLWSTKCRKSYSFGPQFPSISAPGHIKTDDDPYNPDGTRKPNRQCTPRPGECFEDCVCAFIENDSRNPSWYYTGPSSWGGNSCTDRKDVVITICTAKCKGKK